MPELQVPEWMSKEAVDTLSRGYLWNAETPRGMFERVSNQAAKILDYPELSEDLFEVLWRGFLGLATPVASNFGTSRGLPISCYSTHLSDSVQSIYSHLKEVAALSKNGGGVGVYLGDIRPSGSPIASGGKSTGIVPWARQYDQCASVVSQGGVRRGSFAMYLPIDHPDLAELLRTKDHSQGDPRDFIDSNIAVSITDEWVESMIAGDRDKQKIFGEVLKARMISGSPYIIYIDNANRANPECYTQRGLKVSLSNLCSEIFLHTDENHTFVCVLSSINLARWEEWKDWRGAKTGKSVPELAVYLLDAVVEEFCHKGDRMTSMGRSVRFARKSRALGLGTMGLHALYQSKSLPFASKEARDLNIETHRFIKEQAIKASEEMAKRYGEPEWCEGSGRRHTHLMAIAPTRSNSVICGAVSQGIEPIDANYYVAKQAKGTFVRKNPYLENHLESIGKNTEEVWESILEFRGSVQHLDFLSEDAKNIFLTARETDQFELVKQASDRQPYVCQGQSLNLFVDPESSPEYLFKLHLSAWKGGLKSLYYLKSSSLLVKRKKLETVTKTAKIITKETCPYCTMAKSLLKSKGYKIEEIDRAEVPDSEFPYRTVPQIWINGSYIGGYTDLAEKIGTPEKQYGDCAACEG
jgi:ribonucleoside-diphosphate reductase alpha chain